MNDELRDLREQIVKGLAGYGSCIGVADARAIVGAIFGDIEAAGYSVVKTDWMKRNVMGYAAPKDVGYDFDAEVQV